MAGLPPRRRGRRGGRPAIRWSPASRGGRTPSARGTGRCRRAWGLLGQAGGSARLRYRGISETMTPPKLRRIVDLFAGAPKDLRLQALLEYSRKVPPLPDHLAGHRAQMEQVVECQLPFFLATEVDGDRRVHLFFRSEERRVGKEGRSRVSSWHAEK